MKVITRVYTEYDTDRPWHLKKQIVRKLEAKPMSEIENKMDFSIIQDNNVEEYALVGKQPGLCGVEFYYYLQVEQWQQRLNSQEQ